MSNIKLWTRNFITLVGANGLLFAGFHFLLPTLQKKVKKQNEQEELA